ncbi:YjdF family protein [Vagococcus carniphilus]|uniref:YjdF family protein n=1 Tax=Vagococcus carniphilus TaxID=218144 RepID=A0AAW8U6E8_9ENTE|nr:YjdF family protein [Vagococcus carniphilus]MDT2833352.1 YjdF family protein [Vagococcus carniphilus]
MSLTIYFNGQYWCGLIEYFDEKNQWVVREYVFGPEPKAEEVFNFIHYVLPNLLNEKWLAKNNQIQTSKERRKINPKRLHRMISKEKQQKGVSSKSQEAIRLQHEERKKVAKKNKRERKELYLKEQFEKKQAKKREKHKGH